MYLSMGIATTVYTAPLKFIVTKVFTSYTHRRYDWQLGDQIDTFSAFVQTFWIYFVYAFERKPLYYPERWEGVMDVSTPHARMMANIEDSHQGIHFRLEFIIGIISALNWLRLVIMLQLTRKFGPMLTIIGSMFNDLAIFGAMWALFLLIFACSGFLLFNELES